MMSAMMHLYMMVIAVIVACVIRLLSVSATRISFIKQPSRRSFKPLSASTNPAVPAIGTERQSQSASSWGQKHWQRRWAKTLSAFLVPPVFLLMTALAIVIMGPSSCHAWEGWFSYQLSMTFLLIGVLSWIYLGWIGFVSQQNIRHSPTKIIQTSFGDIASHILDIPVVFSAQVGCWNPTLVVSQGLIETLDEAQLSAVIAHETGHSHYKDTFWFLWLGGLRRLTFWLPGTEHLWKELLLLRELRADRWATQYVDKLVLAESLMQVVSANVASPNVAAGSVSGSMSKASRFTETTAASFSCPTSTDRLSQRIDAILAEESVPVRANSYVQGNQWIASWMSMSWALTPLLTIPLHH